MPSTFTDNTGIEKIADGEQAGTWGQRTNDNFDIIDRALNGSVSIALSGATGTVTTGQGSTSGVNTFGQFAVLVFTGSPSGTNTVTIAPNTAQKTYIVRNTTAETVVLSQGSGGNTTVPAGLTKFVYADGGGATAAVFDITNTLSGNLTGNVTGNVTGNLTGNVVSGADAIIHGVTVGRGAGDIVSNTALGNGALSSITSGQFNTAVGSAALSTNSGGFSNTAVGINALRDNITGASNTATGLQSLVSNTSGNNNVAFGSDALRNNTTGFGSTAVGNAALFSNTTSGFHVAVGQDALRDCTTGSNNIGIGGSAGRSTSPRTITTASNEICIGNNDHTGAFIKIAFTVTSDARDKAEFAPIPHGLDFVNALEPTEYQFKAGGREGEADGKRRYGFLAQDVLAAEGDNPVIVNNDDPDSLKMTYDYLVPVLVNAIKELTAQVDDLKAEVAASKGQ